MRNQNLHLAVLSRTAVIIAFASWLGGLAFYSAVVIPTAHDVLGSHTQVGFITQQVTLWINRIAVVALTILGMNVMHSWRQSGAAITLAATWMIMAAIQVLLFVLHPALDRLLDTTARVVLDGSRFYKLHRVYLLGTTAQLFAGLLHIWYVLCIWKRHDRLTSFYYGGGLPWGD